MVLTSKDPFLSNRVTTTDHQSLRILPQLPRHQGNGKVNHVFLRWKGVGRVTITKVKTNITKLGLGML